MYIVNIMIATLMGTMESDDGNEYGGDNDSGDESLDGRGGGDDDGVDGGDGGGGDEGGHGGDGGGGDDGDGGDGKCKLGLGESVRLTSFPW